MIDNPEYKKDGQRARCLTCQAEIPRGTPRIVVETIGYEGGIRPRSIHLACGIPLLVRQEQRYHDAIFAADARHQMDQQKRGVPC